MTGQDRRLCDYCGETSALLYCRADSAKLCFTCDKEVHSTNQLFTKHSRSILCDSCDDAPASFFCETERSVLCHNCDWDTHNSSSNSIINGGVLLPSSVSGSGGGGVHNRRPIEWFNGCPSVSELMGFLGFDGGSDKVGVLGCGGDDVDGFGYEEDMFVWDTPSFVSLDDLVFSSDKTHDFKSVDVPPLPKNRNTICGQHKEEIIHQLRSLAMSESNPSFENIDVKPLDDLQFLISEENLKSPGTLSGCIDDQDLHTLAEDEVTESLWFTTDGDKMNRAYLPHPSASLTSYCEMSPRSLDRLPDDGPKLSGNCHERNEAQLENPMSSNSFSFPPRIVHHEISSQERESALTRYKEKKKTRRYDKHVRYASRKARAETRTRIRGRFAKMDH